MNDLMSSELLFEFSPASTERGYWIYVACISTRPSNSDYYYVGMTGDTGSTNAGSVHSRFLSHLDSKATAKGNSLYKALGAKGVLKQEKVTVIVAAFRLDDEKKSYLEHRVRRADIAHVEEQLVLDLLDKGYEVIGAHWTKKRPTVPPALQATYSQLLSSVLKKFPR